MRYRFQLSAAELAVEVTSVVAVVEEEFTMTLLLSLVDLQFTTQP
jgi:hypothetical protein